MIIKLLILAATSIVGALTVLGLIAVLAVLVGEPLDLSSVEPLAVLLKPVGLGAVLGGVLGYLRFVDDYR